MRAGGLKHVSDFNRLFASKHGDVSYTIAMGEYDAGSFDEWEYGSDSRELCAEAYDFKGREENELAADYIQYLTFDSCKGMSKCLLNVLTSITSLKFLTIMKCGGIECILTYDQYKAPQFSNCRFQAPEVLRLNNLDNFMGVIHKLETQVDLPPSSIFSSLKRLEICGCKKMKKLGLPLSAFENLESISIQQCQEIDEIIQVFAAAADDALVISLPSLKRLYLIRLPSLERFSYAPVICNLLKEEDFILRDCPRSHAFLLNRGTPDSYEPFFRGDDDGVERDGAAYQD